MYQPKPIETAGVEIAQRLTELVERLSEHNHDIWAAGRMREGWTFGPKRDDRAKTHPDLVPYAQLTESEKEYDRSTVRGVIKALLALGYRIEKT